jgi:hypothetical protein
MKRLILLVAGILCSLSAVALDLSVKPYVGADLSYRYMNFKRDLGRDELRHSLPGFNVFAGFRALNFFGLEAGTRLTYWVKKDDLKHSVQSIHASAMGFLPLAEGVEAVGGLGLSSLNMAYKARDLDGSHKLRVKKVVPLASLGIQYSLTDSLSARVMYSVEATSKVKHEDFKPKDSSIMHAGLVLNF